MPYLSTRQAAEALGTTDSNVRAYIRAGRLKARRVSRTKDEILNLLMEKDLYGLEMVARCNSPNQNTIYVKLNQLENRGLIKSRKIPPKEGSHGARRICSITTAGRRAVAEKGKNDYRPVVYSIKESDLNSFIAQRTKAKGRGVPTMVKYNGETLSVVDWAQRFGIKRQAVHQMISRHGPDAIGLLIEKYG